ncbi:hypothetical protein VNO77_02060 [Canavalia gladiata]|uniref:Uncharacterized protein n=1 Tax=Canavalia gladiata TaxID=3824 RepID=A0AAN9MSA6_CANGL
MDLKVACLLQDVIKRLFISFLTLKSIVDCQKLLRLIVPMLRFLQHCPIFFPEFLHLHWAFLSCFFLIDTDLLLDFLRRHHPPKPLKQHCSKGIGVVVGALSCNFQTLGESGPSRKILIDL